MKRKNKSKNLSERMKRYEFVERKYLTPKIPIIIRLDGKAFHTFCRGMKKPYDEIMMNSMVETAKYLCENIQGVKLAYTQSDEITLVLYDQNPKSDGWFEYNLQKMVSVSASMATLAFNKYFSEQVLNRFQITPVTPETKFPISKKDYDYASLMNNKINKALFDSRVFSIPEYEVVNCLIWRQQDATRNSIQSTGRVYFSQKQLNGKSCNEIQDILFKEKGVNWNDYPIAFKRGICIVKQDYYVKNDKDEDVKRTKWEADYTIPIFTQNRDYIENKLIDEVEEK